MQGWAATKRHGVARKRSTKRLNHTGNLFTKNLQLTFCSVILLSISCLEKFTSYISFELGALNSFVTMFGKKFTSKLSVATLLFGPWLL